MVRAAPPSPEIRSSRHLRRHVSRDPADPHQSSHGLLHPYHRIWTCVFHSTL